MSLFGKIFGKSENENREELFWKPLTSEEELAEAVKRSFEKKVVLFKHSTRCIISRTVLKNFERSVEASMPDAEFYFLDLLQFRNISNKIADDFGIMHQSPQLIVLENGIATADASHDRISVELI